MNALGDVYVWGCFSIPPNGSQLLQDQQPLQQDLGIRNIQIKKHASSMKQATLKSKEKRVAKISDVLQGSAETDHWPNLKETIAFAPKRLKFLFDKSLKMKIKNYVIDAE